MTRVVAPRPIAFVSSLAASGTGNLAPFSFFNIGGSNPPSCIICPVTSRDGVNKDTLHNIEETGEYTINIVTFAMAEAMNQTSFTYPRGVDEFDKAGFTRVPSTKVKPPRVGESPVSLECRLHKVVKHGEGPLSSNYVIGEIVLFHCDDAVLTDGMPDNAKIDAIGRLGEDYYTRTHAAALFRLGRPTGG